MTKLYCIKDAKIGFTTVFTMPNKMAAMRMFEEEVNKDTSYLCKFSKDFALYELGEMDDNTGAITSEVKFVEEAENLKHQS